MTKVKYSKELLEEAVKDAYSIAQANKRIAVYNRCTNLFKHMWR